MRSCPSRGTWIEIKSSAAPVNTNGKSCPSRGTWIEIGVMQNISDQIEVVPLAGPGD